MDNLYKVDAVLIVISLVVVMGLIGYARPLVIAPLDDYASTEGEILFSIEKADKLLIDDNLEFSSPTEYLLGDGLEINLDPGVYYWKAVGVVSSKVRTLTINSEVNFELKELGDGYGVVNVGNVRLNVDVYSGDELIEKVKLNPDEEARAEGDKFVGGLE